MGVEKFKDAERVVKALANRRRMAMIEFLKKKKEASVTAIASELKLSVKATSKHLALLGAAGIVEKEQRNTHMYFWVAKDLPAYARGIVSFL